uniref:Uncharacterized protein n=1 Tax=Acrobeloides nanus TaxID=290746 RepID=A0A914CT83_9BILA
MKVFSIFFIALFCMAFIQTNAGGIDWGNVDPLCTVSCGAYWFCIARQGSGCVSPSKCDCSQFAGRK